MAEYIQCPYCKKYLNLDKQEAQNITIYSKNKDVVYLCKKCGTKFTEYGEIIECPDDIMDELDIEEIMER